MTYTLAKRLKDAGFPMPEHDFDDGSYGSCHRDCETGSDFCFPTLSELIEACGEGFETLSRDTTTEKLCWIANNYNDPDAPEEKVFGWYEGTTPEEAVALLWLALHEEV